MIPTESAAEAIIGNDSLVREFDREKKLPVIEQFGPTIQGEGPLAGRKTMFLRLGGCDYRCGKCDSLHAVLPKAVKANATRKTAEEIVSEMVPRMRETGTVWVTLSGGNPCLWDLSELVERFTNEGCLVAVETQGTLAPPWLTKCHMVVVSPKTFGMGEKFEADKLRHFLTMLKGHTTVALKMVVFSAIDIEQALAVGEIATDELGVIPRGLRFLSLGNPFPPPLDDNLAPRDAEMPVHLQETYGNKGITDAQIHKLELLQSYRRLIEEVVNDHRIEDWVFLPQLHVLAFGNEPGR